MKILVDADACPVVREARMVARAYQLELVLLCDTNHVLQSDYGKVYTVGAGADAVDLALINLARAGDVVVTQDYGVAALALGKQCYVLHQNGWQYTNENIDRLLMERHLAKKARTGKGKHHLKGPKKRTEEDNNRFVARLEELIRGLL